MTDDFYKWAVESVRGEPMHRGSMTDRGFVCDPSCPAVHDSVIESMEALEASENPPDSGSKGSS